MTASPTGSPVDADCVAAVQATASLCESLGHRVEEATLSVDGDAFTAHFVNQWACANAWAIADWEGGLGRSVAEEDVEPLSWALIALGRAIDGGTYLRSVQELQLISRQIADYFEGIDVLLTPTLAEPPAPLGTFDSPPGEPLTGLFRAASYVPFTPPFNVTGQPGISLPLHWNEAGLPIGVQFVGRFGDEETLLSLAGQLEEAAPWAHAGRRSRRRRHPGGRLPRRTGHQDATRARVDRGHALVAVDAERRRGGVRLHAVRQVRLAQQGAGHGDEGEPLGQRHLNGRQLGDATEEDERRGERSAGTAARRGGRTPLRRDRSAGSGGR